MRPISQDSWVMCRTQFEGFHCWPDAPDEVEFLRTRHRHMFHVELHVPVTHADRDVEFILLKRALEAELASWGAEQGVGSCEMMAKRIIRWAVEHTGQMGTYFCDVTEDGENGARQIEMWA